MLSVRREKRRRKELFRPILNAEVSASSFVLTIKEH